MVGYKRSEYKKKYIVYQILIDDSKNMPHVGQIQESSSLNSPTTPKIESDLNSGCNNHGQIGHSTCLRIGQMGS